MIPYMDAYNDTPWFLLLDGGKWTRFTEYKQLFKDREETGGIVDMETDGKEGGNSGQAADSAVVSGSSKGPHVSQSAMYGKPKNKSPPRPAASG